ncbi:uncharacterized protein [Mytilus edulis]|uniref:uncharacterized protein n=1 Tax=Mytilus edulis TaxID=6550 RepID=UPI0039EEE4AB
MATEDYIKLTNYGINPKVAKELCSLFNTGNVSRKELDKKALDALKECNVNEAIRVIKTFSESFKSSNVKTKSDSLCDMIKLQLQTHKKASKDPACPRNQSEHSPGSQSNVQPGGQGWQLNTELFHGVHRVLYPHHHCNQQQCQGYNLPPSFYELYNQPPHLPQYGQRLPDIMQGPRLPTPYMHQHNVPLSPDGTTTGQGPTPYPPLFTGQHNPPKLQLESWNEIDHQNSHQRDKSFQGRVKSPILKRAKTEQHNSEENEIQDHPISGKKKQYEAYDILKVNFLDSEESSKHDDFNKRGGRRRYKGRGSRAHKDETCKNKQHFDKQDYESSKNEDDKNEMKNNAIPNFVSKIDLLNQMSNREIRENPILTGNFGSIEIGGKVSTQKNRRTEERTYRDIAAQSSRIDEDVTPSHDDSYHKHTKNRIEINANTHRKWKGGVKGHIRDDKQHHESRNEQRDDKIPDVDDNDVFKFLIKNFGGGCTFKDFLRRCNLFPKECNIRMWFKKHSNRFHVFWKGETIIYLQPFFQDAKICTRWNNKKMQGQCRNAQCNFFHICRQFISDNCIDKDCPLSHSFRHQHNLYLKNKLGISDFCDADISTVLKCNFPSVCADYIYNNGCKIENAEERCPHLHLCRMKILGKCEDPCIFRKIHSITQYHNKWVLTSCHMKGWPAARVLKAIYVPPRQGKVREDYSDLSQNKVNVNDVSICYDSDVHISSESLSSTASDSARKFNKFNTSVENLSIDDEKTKSGRRECIKLSEYIIHAFFQMEKYNQEKQENSFGKVVKPIVPRRPSKVRSSDPDYQERNPSVLKDDIDISKICVFMSKDQCSSASCKNLHLPSGIPYLWQIQMFGKWFSLTLAENEKIEKGYCNLLDVESTEIKYIGIKYSFHICFSNMQAIIYYCNGQPGVGYNQYCDVRRLSTPSFTEKKIMVDSYLTQWRWYWRDDSNNRKMYSKDVQFTFESKYQTKQKTYLYTRDNYYMYMIDFGKMTQVNLVTDKVQIVIRRPLFVSQDDVRRKKYPDSIPFPAGMSTAKPMHFFDRNGILDFDLVELDTTGKEFVGVLKSFQDSMSQAQFGIRFIYRIHNRKLRSKYNIKKKVMLAVAKKDGHGRNIDGRDLFHGAESWNACRDICTNNFDFSTSGSVATPYGQGFYFAVHSKMMSYSTRSTYLPTNIRFMFRAKVLVGQFTKGHPSFCRPPKIPEHEHKLYDSCVDQVHDPKLFVVFDRNQCYPDYLIMYTDKKSISVNKTGSSSNFQMHTDQFTTHPINYENVLHSGYQMVDLRRPKGQTTSLTIQSYQDFSATNSEESPVYTHSSESFSNKPNANNLGPPAKSYNKIISMDIPGKSSNLQKNTVVNLYGMASCQGPLIHQRPKEYPTLTTKQNYIKLWTTHSDETPAVLGAHLDNRSSLLTTPLLCDGMYIDCIPDKRLDTRPAFFSHVINEGSLLTTPLLCDGMYIDCIIDKRLDTRPAFFSNVMDEDTSCLLYQLEKTQPDQFAGLVYTAHYLKSRKNIKSNSLRLLLRYAINNESSLMCRLILSFIGNILKPEPYLIQMLLLALDEGEKGCARAISWFITRAFYLQYQSLMKELIDIWPSICCPCSKRLKSSAYSTEVVIVVELENDCPQLPKHFCQLQIISIRNDDMLRSDGPDVNKELSSLNGSLHLPQNEAVSSVMAKELFTKHSKLTLICKSFRKSKGYNNGKLDYILNVPCVQLYCSAKGCIPIGEDHFPKDVCGLPTDILQGTPSLMANLKVGDKIGTDNYKMGTLGGFVKVRGDVCFLTCLHVFLSAEDLASDNISLDDDAGVIVKCYSTGSVTGQGQMIPYECGRIREIAFEMDNERETSIDAALITLNDRSQIDENDYLASDITKAFAIRDLGMKSKYLNENCIDFKPLCYSIPCPKVVVVAVGAISGICNAEAQVKENNEKSIDLESIEQTFSNVILTELKEKVGQVIEQLKGQVHNITCDQICAIIGQVCDPSISDEFKSVILDIIKNILPRIIKRQSQNGNTNTNNNHEDAVFCSTCAGLNQPMSMCFHGIIDEMVISKSTSHLSSIFSDVHMQRTFLRRTGDQQSLKRTSRRVYNQIHVSNIPFKPGDSGTCIYTVQPSAGCIGMAIANHPQSGCIATPIKEILKHFKIKIK